MAVLNGDSGNNEIVGTDGYDTLNGGFGDDTLNGGLGSDALYGGEGNDTYQFGRGYGQDKVSDYINGTDINTIQLLADIAVSDVRLTRINDRLELTVVGTTDSLTLSDYFKMDPTSNSPSRQTFQIQFADGTTWDKAAIRNKVLETAISGTEANDELLGTINSDYIVSFAGDDVLNGEEGIDTLEADLGNDTLSGGLDRDYLYGGEGNDVLNGGLGNDYLYGGEGNDVLNGNEGNDELFGEAGDDILIAGTGNSFIVAGGTGNDSLYGGDSNDNLYGGEGNDLFNGGLGNDYMAGEQGNDTYQFGRGYGQDRVGNIDSYNENEINTIQLLADIAVSDVRLTRIIDGLQLSVVGTTDTLTLDIYFYGYSNNSTFNQAYQIQFADGTTWDKTRILEVVNPSIINGTISLDSLKGDDTDNTLYGLAASDTLVGGGGNDVLNGDEGYDSLEGGSGNDSLNGGLDNDYLYGGEGNDVLNGGLGSDALYGGQGNDTYQFGRGYGHDGVGDNDNYNENEINTIQLLADIAVSDVRLTRNQYNDLELLVAGTTDRLALAGYFYVSSELPSPSISNQAYQIQFADGTTWDKAAIRNKVLETAISGTEANDELLGTMNRDYIVSFAGDDVLNGEEGIDTLEGDLGNDTLNGGLDRDYLYGGEGNDVLNGDEGNDALHGEDGNDLLNGGLGSDYLQGDEGGDVLNGAEGNDELNGDAGDDTLNGGLGSDALYGGRGNDTYQFGRGYGQDRVFDGDNNGTEISTIQLLADIAVDDVRLTRFGLNLQLSVVGTTDSLILHSYFYHIVSYYDYITPNQAYQIQFADGTTWDKTTIRNKLFDITGTTGNDTLIGGNTNDLIDGGEGNDVIDGGTGADTLNGGKGDDTYIADGSDTTNEATGEGYDTVITPDDFTLPDNVENLYQTGTGNTTGTGNASDNVLQGNSGDNQLDGKAGKDALRGGTGNDSLSGGVGNDSLTGDDGNDVLSGDSGADTLMGGTGSDTYLFGTAFGQDTLDDYSTTAELNTIDLSAYNANQLTFTSVGKDYVISVTGTTDLITLRDVLNANHVSTYQLVLATETLTQAQFFPNTAPTGNPTAILANGQEDTAYTVTAAQLLQGFSDANGDLLNIANLTVNHGTITDNGNGTFTITPTTNYSGAVSLSYQVSDSNGGLVNATQSFNLIKAVIVGTTVGDLLHGDTGDDIFIVNHVRDVVFEEANGGIDTVQSTLSHNLRDNVENLILVGDTDLSGTGNNTNNNLTGNNGNNRLLAGDGNDTLSGGAGGDTLNGGAGADVMFGGTGNDTFTVENTDDTVTEFTDEGFDTVNSFMSYTLTENVERLSLEGMENLNGSGNDLDNTLNGNNANNWLIGGLGNDILQGKGGADTLEGGMGNDLYYVDNAGDIVIELASEGTDKVSSSISYTLTTNVEQLFLTGIAGLTGTGNALNNVIYGNGGDNHLDGGLGDDSLNGGLGDDSYQFGLLSDHDIINNTDASDGLDVVLFDAGITADQVWLSHVNNDLEVSIIGTANSVKVQDWYSHPSKRVDGLHLADGRSILASEIETLVSAMAAFTPPAIGQTTLTTQQHTALDSIIAVSW